MNSNKRVTDDMIADWLEESDHNSDDNFSGDDSEIEDHVSNEDAQDDVAEGYIEDESIAEELVPSFVPENSKTLESSSSDHRILVPARRTLKGKNQHCWSTSKGESRGGTTARNIVHTSRGPTRMCRNIFEPSLCFDLFITEDIVGEIVRWTNVEISRKRPSVNTHATCRDTCSIEVRAYFGILTLTAAIKDKHLTATELFDSTFSGSRINSFGRTGTELLLKLFHPTSDYRFQGPLRFGNVSNCGHSVVKSSQSDCRKIVLQQFGAMKKKTIA
ncbi:unnamed protein product [Parnassius mnemosyne]|uniref:PiggyBac transposable element-derived protein domain-containing protein n=1 Tax=Parnassius mnemosyne TaxID=213953 RepID=A0AAV1LJC3_9NEOP